MVLHTYIYMHIATQVYVFLVTKHCSLNLISSMPAPHQAKGLCTWGVTIVITRQEGSVWKKPDYQVSNSFMSQDSQKRRDDFKKAIILSLALWISCNYSWDIVIEWPLLTPGGLYFQVLYPNWSGQSSVIHSHWPHHFTCMEVTWDAHAINMRRQLLLLVVEMDETAFCFPPCRGTNSHDHHLCKWIIEVS